MIDLQSDDRRILLKTLEKHLKNCEIWAFGSRVNGKARLYSDLDLVLKSKSEKAIELTNLALLQEELACSDISLIIDIHDWYTIPEHFKKTIHSNTVLLKET